jgi:hypothetical protein
MFVGSTLSWLHVTRAEPKVPRTQDLGRYIHAALAAALATYNAASPTQQNKWATSYS